MNFLNSDVLTQFGLILPVNPHVTGILNNLHPYLSSTIINTSLVTVYTVFHITFRSCFNLLSNWITGVRGGVQGDDQTWFGHWDRLLGDIISIIWGAIQQICHVIVNGFHGPFTVYLDHIHGLILVLINLLLDTIRRLLMLLMEIIARTAETLLPQTTETRPQSDHVSPPSYESVSFHYSSNNSEP